VFYSIISIPATIFGIASKLIMSYKTIIRPSFILAFATPPKTNPINKTILKDQTT
jgi:hypothetical protein